MFPRTSPSHFSPARNLQQKVLHLRGGHRLPAQKRSEFGKSRRLRSKFNPEKMFEAMKNQSIDEGDILLHENEWILRNLYYGNDPVDKVVQEIKEFEEQHPEVVMEERNVDLDTFGLLSVEKWKNHIKRYRLPEEDDDDDSSTARREAMEAERYVDVDEDEVEEDRKHQSRISHFYLAQSYQIGYAVDEINHTKAFRHFELSAKMDFPPAMTCLGTCYLHGYGTEKDEEEAVKWYRKAAKEGCVEGMYNFGLCLQDGVGVKENVELAIQWMNKSATEEHVDAMYVMAMYHMHGAGPIKQDQELANEMLTKIVDRFDHASSQLRGIEEEVVVAVEQAEEKEDSVEEISERIIDICSSLAKSFFFGRGTEKSPEMAEKLVKFAVVEEEGKELMSSWEKELEFMIDEA
eukprot:763644-Hanusia_phi.AAC.1